MEKHIQLPQNFWIGKKSLNNLEKFKEKNTLVVTGPTTRKIAGEKAAEILEADLMIVEEPSVQEAEKVREEIEEKRKDLAIAVGGGKVIDVTKSGSYE
ncbi:MAG: iron-containing alcohol dehydrogenase, partial [archaeon]